MDLHKTKTTHFYHCYSCSYEFSFYVCLIWMFVMKWMLPEPDRAHLSSASRQSQARLCLAPSAPHAKARLGYSIACTLFQKSRHRTIAKFILPAIPRIGWIIAISRSLPSPHSPQYTLYSLPFAYSRIIIHIYHTHRHKAIIIYYSIWKYLWKDS